MRSKWLTTLLKYGLGVALLAFVIYRHWEPAEGSGSVGLKSALARDNRWEFFSLALLCLAVNISMTFVRWWTLVRAQDLPFSLKDAFRLGLVGHFFNTFLPGSVGGDVLKAAFIAREQQRRTVAVSTVLIDRGVGLWGLIALTALVGSVFWWMGDPLIERQPELQRVIRVANGLMAVSLAVWLLLGLLPDRRAQRFARRLTENLGRVGKVLAEFWRAVWLYRTRGLSVLKGLLLAMTGHVFTVLSFYFAALTFQPAGLPTQMPGLMEHYLIVPAGLAFQGFFPAPGGMGGGEFIFGLLYERLGQPAEGGILGSLGQRLCAWMIGGVGYTIYLFMKRDLQKAIPGGEPQTTTDSSSPDDRSSTTQDR